LTWHIAYTTACCYRTSRDKHRLKSINHLNKIHLHRAVKQQ